MLNISNRTYIAAKALQGLIANPRRDYSYEEACEVAKNYADNLINVLNEAPITEEPFTEKPYLVTQVAKMLETSTTSIFATLSVLGWAFERLDRKTATWQAAKKAIEGGYMAIDPKIGDCLITEKGLDKIIKHRTTLKKLAESTK